MKRYLITKIGGSDIMVGLITKALQDMVYFGEDECMPRSSNLGAVLIFNFTSSATIDEITFALKDIAIQNFFVTEVTDEGFRASLSEKFDENLILNKFKHTTEKTLDDMNEKELNKELQYAEEHQLFERCSVIIEKMKAINSN